MNFRNLPVNARWSASSLANSLFSGVLGVTALWLTATLITTAYGSRHQPNSCKPPIAMDDANENLYRAANEEESKKVIQSSMSFRIRGDHQCTQ
ncbi:hypothetical protein [Methylocystis rosea]|uniref:Uncharacterized protein n=1 Tax=Methylocystis rosea TaxID=173366 RepID=A0A3G8MCI3_9HYPH|nr:hypothetical protein [Methylocystis rosea]AZG78852.1 hypothetical protein EHO51_18650 [Methylocystis rosea]